MAFSVNTGPVFKETIIINGSYGLGELVVHGGILPDTFIVQRAALQTASLSVIEKRMGVKDKVMIHGDDTSERVKVIATEKELQDRFCLEDTTVLQLADPIIKIGEYYSSLLEKWTPVDIEWAIDGLSKEIFIVQAKPGIISNKEFRMSNVEVVNEPGI
jgi:pyruvate,water dikinase